MSEQTNTNAVNAVAEVRLEIQIEQALAKKDYALVTKLGHELLTQRARAAREAFEAKSAERAELSKRITAALDAVMADFLEELENVTGGAYHVVYDLAPDTQPHYQCKVMDMPKERKASTGEANTFDTSTADLIAKHGGDWQALYDAAEAADKAKTYTDQAGKVRVPGNARYAIRQKLIKLEKGS